MNNKIKDIIKKRNEKKKVNKDMPLRKDSDVIGKVKQGKEKGVAWRKQVVATRPKNKSNIKSKKDTEGKLFNYQQLF